MKNELRKILVSLTDRLGDVILSLPCATALKARYPGSEVWMLVQPSTAPVVELCQDVDGVLLSDGPDRIAPAVLRDQQFDAAVVLYPRYGIVRALHRAAVPRRIGTSRRLWSLWFNERVPVSRRASERHETEYNLELLQPLDADAGAPEFRLQVPAYLRDRADGVLDALGIGPNDKFIVLHPGSGGSAGNWPASHFAELARKIVERLGCCILLTGTKAESDLLRQVQGAEHPAIIPAPGCLDVSELAAVLQRADAVVGNSSGPLHLARALDTVVCGLYPSDRVCGPRRWGPYGRPEAALTPEYPAAGPGRQNYRRRSAQLAGISVERVLGHLEYLLRTAEVPPQPPVSL